MFGSSVSFLNFGLVFVVFVLKSSSLSEVQKVESSQVMFCRFKQSVFIFLGKKSSSVGW
jgi:hypothetical protein